MAAEKTLVRTTARHAASGLEVTRLRNPSRSDGLRRLRAAVDSRRRPGRGHRRRRPAGLGHVPARRVRCRRLPPLVHRSPARAARLPPVGKVIGRYDIEPALDRLARSGPRERADGRNLSAHGFAMRLEYQILIAVALDLVLGDPRWLPHPVRGIGRLALVAARRLSPPRAGGDANGRPVGGACHVSSWSAWRPGERFVWRPRCIRWRPTWCRSS